MKKGRILTLISLLNISFLSFAIDATCPEVTFLNAPGNVDYKNKGVARVPHIGGMTYYLIGASNYNPQKINFEKWTETSINGLTEVVCEYSSHTPEGKLFYISFRSELRGWRPKEPLLNSPWHITRTMTACRDNRAEKVTDCVVTIF